MIGNNKSESPLISIVINCFNGEEFLKQALDSVYNQTYKNWEIIFWNNCSTDGSVNLINNYDRKIKYFEAEFKTNLGEARNLAIQKCNGDFITFIDCDDIWISTKLEQQIKFMIENDNFILSYTGIEEIDKNENHLRYIRPQKKSGNIIKELLLQYDIPIVSTMINAKLLKDSGLTFDANIQASEEYCLFMQLACKYEIGVINEILVKYRVFGTSLTSSKLSILGLERRYTLNKIRSYCISMGLDKYYNEAFSRSYYYDARWFMSQKKQLIAIKTMSKIALNNYRYLFLFLLTFLPYCFWKFVHIKIQGRV